MIAPLAKLIEWAFVQHSFRRMPHPEGQNPRLDEAIQFLNRPDFMPAESQPAQLVFDNARMRSTARVAAGTLATAALQNRYPRKPRDLNNGICPKWQTNAASEQKRVLRGSLEPVAGRH